MKKEILEKHTATWSQMTDENRLSEELEHIANTFGVLSDKENAYEAYKDFYIIFTSIRTLHDVEKHLPNELYQYRYAKMHELLDTIERIEGKDVRDIVYQCL